MISNWYTFVPTIFLEINNSLWDKTQKITRLLGHFPFYYRTTSHFAIFLYQSQKSLLFSLFSIPGIPPFLLCSLLLPCQDTFFLLRDGWFPSFSPSPSFPSYYATTSYFPIFFAFNPRKPSFPSYYRTGSHLPIFCQSRKSLLSIFIFRKHETHTSLCSLDGFLIYQGD